MNKKTTLICGAILQEINLFIHHQFKTLLTGVGNVSSTFHLVDYLFHDPSIETVIFLGSCGVYQKEKIKYKFGYSNNFLTKEKLTIYNKVKQPKAMKTKIEFIQKMKLNEFLYGKTNSINYITTDDLNKEERAYFYSKNIVFENMETFGLAFVCEKMKKHFTAFYAITNEVGKDGSKNWTKNYQSMSLELQHNLLNSLNTYN